MSSKKQDNAHGTRKSLLSGVSIVAAAAAAALTGGTAHAQDANAQGQDEEIVVTGTRIPQPNLVTTSPVTQLTAADITTSGVTRVEDLTNQLPQVFAAQGSNVSNGASGTATVNLRGLGSQRTLVLLNGRRMPYGDPGSSAADLNQIPGAMVERVEVLTGGASAVYGSDAIAGVVNFIMRDNFEGFRIDAQYGFHQHTNDDNDGHLRDELEFRHSTNPSQYNLPPDNVVDGYSKEITAIFGASSPDGRGNVTAYLGYRSNDAILQGNRDYSGCALANPSTSARPYAPAGTLHWNCGGSATSFPGYFYYNGAAQTINQTTGNFQAFTPNNLYNFGPLNYYQRPDERYSAGAFAHYQINDRIEAYAEAMFTDYRTDAQIAPSGDFFNTNTINCGNPFVQAIGNQGTTNGGLCSAGQIAANSVVSLYIARRNVEGGGRDDNREFESYRTVLGVRGAVSDNWDYDISGTYARTNLSQVYRNDFSVTRMGRALNVTNAGPDGILGNGDDAPICASVLDGTDPACVPWNVFTPGGVTPAALAYLQVPLVRTASTTQQDVIATLTGDTGIVSPAAHSPVQVSLGAEYRRDALDSTTDASFSSGDGAGQGGPTLGLQGHTDVFELFGEARVPLVEDAPFAHLLSVDLAYRWSDYDSGTQTDTYKVGAEWAPTEDIRFRASFQHAVRAPNVIELFAAQGAGLFNLGFDPCDNVHNGGVTPASCIGVNPWQVTLAQSNAGGLNNPAGQYNGLFGGNPNLSPEEADTTTIGVVFQPRFAPGLNVSVDYFDIDVTNLITATGAAVLSACYFGGDIASCNAISRNPANGRLWGGNPNARVFALNTNIGGLKTQGFDLNANYHWDLGGAGGLSFQLIGTYLSKLETDEGAATGRNPYDCVGLWSGDANCGTPNPEWRHRFRVGWETPWDLELDLTWRYFSSVHREQNVGGQGGFEADGSLVANQLGTTLDATSFFDIAGTWKVRDNASLRFGVNNFLDEVPPISTNTHVGAGFGNGNTFPQVYDATGRFVFAGITVDF